MILLIDEIDKADIEFPNDLLNELDEMTFHVNELDEEVKAKHRPVVIITSNSEKELPDAFLRRCIFYYIEFPDEEMMERIVKVHYPEIEERLMRDAIKKFYWIRQVDGLRKKPSTSELLDWIKALAVGRPRPGEDRLGSPLPRHAHQERAGHGKGVKDGAGARPLRHQETIETPCSSTSSISCGKRACPSP